jgi:AraC family transcriptional regulator
MNRIELLSNALEYMENHLDEEITTPDIAGSCYCSRSTLEKLFRYVYQMSVRDYIVRRRMTKCARALCEEPERSILDIALQYGYGSNEAFTRAFHQVWNCSPSQFRKSQQPVELFPRLMCPLETGDDYMKERKHMDITELYDLFTARRDCFFVCCDIKNLMEINKISHKAGDLVILEAMNRMNAAAGPEDLVFRIGGDEFALLTDSTDQGYAESVAGKLRSDNGRPVRFEELEIPLNLHIGIAGLENKTVRYNELFTSLHTAIRDSKEP